MSDIRGVVDTELIKFAAKNLAGQKLRSFLTLLGIVIGIAAILALISLGEGLNASVQAQFQELGTNTLTVMPGGSFGVSMFAELEEDDPDTIERIRGVETAVGIYTDVAMVDFKGEKKSMIIYGADPDSAKGLESVGMVNVEKGRDLTESDHGNILVGANVASTLFEEEVKLKQALEIEGKGYRVIGVMEKASHFFGAIFNNSIVTTLDDLEEITGETYTPFRIMVKASEGQDIFEIKKRIERELEDEHGQKDFTVVTPQQTADVAGSVIGIIQLVLVGIAAISLLVGGIGIMNTMLMAVTERTKEIGIMKSIGATNNRVLSIFLMEAGLIGLAGGVIGILIGTGVAALVSLVAQSSGLALQTVVSPQLIAGALIFSMLVGIISGFIPAKRASSLDPVEAIRAK